MDEPPRSDPASEAQRLTDAIRASARWLLAAAAGVGAVLVTGVTINGIGHVSGLAQVVALAALPVALSAVGFIVFTAMSVFYDACGTIREMPQELRDLEDRSWVRRHSRWPGLEPHKDWQDKVTKQVAERVADLNAFLPQGQRIRTSTEDPANDFEIKKVAAKVDLLVERWRVLRQEQGQALASPASSADSAENIEHSHLGSPSSSQLNQRREFLEDGLDVCLGWLNYRISKRRLTTLRYRLAPCSVIVVLAVVGFSWATSNQRKAPTLVNAPTAITVYFADSNAAHRVLGASCGSTKLSGVAVGGRLDSPEVVVSPQSGCRQARFVLSPRDGLAVPVTTIPRSGALP